MRRLATFLPTVLVIPSFISIHLYTRVCWRETKLRQAGAKIGRGFARKNFSPRVSKKIWDECCEFTRFRAKYNVSACNGRGIGREKKRRISFGRGCGFRFFFFCLSLAVGIGNKLIRAFYSVKCARFLNFSRQGLDGILQ